MLLVLGGKGGCKGLGRITTCPWVLQQGLHPPPPSLLLVYSYSCSAATASVQLIYPLLLTMMVTMMQVSYVLDS